MTTLNHIAYGNFETLNTIANARMRTTTMPADRFPIRVATHVLANVVALQARTTTPQNPVRISGNDMLAHFVHRAGESRWDRMNHGTEGFDGNNQH